MYTNTREKTRQHHLTSLWKNGKREGWLKKRETRSTASATSAKVFCSKFFKRETFQKSLPRTISLATFCMLLFLEMALQVYSPWWCLVMLVIVSVLPWSVFLTLPPGLEAWIVSLLSSQTTRNGKVLVIWQWIMACCPMSRTRFVGSMFKSREKPEMLLWLLWKRGYAC